MTEKERRELAEEVRNLSKKAARTLNDSRARANYKGQWAQWATDVGAILGISNILDRWRDSNEGALSEKEINAFANEAYNAILRLDSTAQRTMDKLVQRGNALDAVFIKSDKQRRAIREEKAEIDRQKDQLSQVNLMSDMAKVRRDEVKQAQYEDTIKRRRNAREIADNQSKLVSDIEAASKALQNINV